MMGTEIETRDSWREREPFSVDQTGKDAFFQREMKELTEHHRRSCQAYDDICNGLGCGTEAPYLPVALFKDLQLRSVPEEEVVRQVTSSGTTGQQVSRIYLDAATAELQRRALCSITGDFIGLKRLPMLIIDSPDVLRDRSKFTARGAGILGFSMMSSKRFYALDDQMRLDRESIGAFLEAAEKAGASFAFGFTFMIWQYFYQALAKAGESLDLQGCTLIHGGGWKKLQDQKVSDDEFRASLRETCGFGEICDYYGMAEQTGSIFMQCSEGHLHASIFSDIEILDPEDFTPCRTGEWGLIALSSWLPTSYPGHKLLTEDWGRILGVDDCPCGRKGKYFEISGRIRRAEIRGCSDTFGGPQEERGSTGTTGAESAGEQGEPGAAKAVAESALTAKPEVLAGQWPPLQKSMAAFDPLVLEFLQELSQLFMKDPAYRQYPDIYALGFWLREAHLKQLQKRQEKAWQVAAKNRTGRGLTLHIAPSNMPTMFAYSWITSLLAGNPNVVRLSGKDLEISDVILQGIRSILKKPDYDRLRQRNVFVKFPRDDRTLEEISARASTRMIWGGDETVRRIGSVPKAEGAIDIAFPDKYSIALLDAEAVAAMDDDELRMQAHLFCRDTYGADQNACSSPRSVFWLNRTGNNAMGGSAEELSAAESGSGEQPDLQQVKQRWWDAVFAEAARYPLEPWMATEKYRMLCASYATDPRPGAVRTWTNRLYVVPCGSAAGWYGAEEEGGADAMTGCEPPKAASGGAPGSMLPEARLGIFYEFDLTDVSELYPLLGEKLQTAVCIGCNPAGFLKGVRDAGCPGIDRAVSAGEALEFDTVWDRKDLVDMLSE